MSRRKVLIILVLLFVIALFYTGADALAVEIKMKPAVPDTEARGLVTIKDAPRVPSDRLLIVDVRGLRPDSVYSVWLVDKDTGKRTPAGLTGQNHFRTDPSGYAHYTDHTDRYKLDHNTLEVAFHPDGDPGNTVDMVVVLTAPLHP